MEARFKHDCTTCIFLGQHNEYDLYGDGWNLVHKRTGKKLWQVEPVKE
jgi:hypothetical protein